MAGFNLLKIEVIFPWVPHMTTPTMTFCYIAAPTMNHSGKMLQEDISLCAFFSSTQQDLSLTLQTSARNVLHCQKLLPCNMVHETFNVPPLTSHCV